MVDIQTLGLNIDGWQYIKTNNPRPIKGIEISGFTSELYHRTVDGMLWSMGRFYFNDVELFRAWGVKEEAHCRFHSIIAELDVVHEGCPKDALKKSKDGYILILEGANTHRIHLF